VVDGVENHLLQLFLGFFQTTNVVPLDVGHFDNGLSQGGGVTAAHLGGKVVHGNLHRVQNFLVNRLFIQIDQLHLFTNTSQLSLGTELLQILTNETVGVLRDFLKLDIGL